MKRKVILLVLLILSIISLLSLLIYKEYQKEKIGIEIEEPTVEEVIVEEIEV